MQLTYKMAEVCEMGGVTRTTIDRWEALCGFPKRIYLGAAKSFTYRDKLGRRVTRVSNCRIGFLKDEVDAWFKNRPRKQ